MTNNCRSTKIEDSALKDYVSPQAIVLPTSRPSESNISEWTIERITDWLDGGLTSPGIIWVAGLPDSSSVRGIVDVCLSKGVLGGSFSFSTRKGQEQARHLMPTLAYQMAQNLPQLESIIASAISIDPKLPERPVNMQFQRLLVDTLQSAAAQNLSLPPLIIIDGLELYQDDSTRRAIVSLIEMSILATRLRVRYIFTSQLAVGYSYVPGLHRDTHLHIDASDQYIAPPYPATQLSPDRGKTIPLAPGFPALVSARRTRGPGSYSRSMMTLGHGFPLWLPTDGSNIAYGEQGVRLGDVGHITPLGQFVFCFNIFEPGENPINARAPTYFEPIQPGLDVAEVIRVENAFEKGAVLHTEGLTVEKESDPLSVRLHPCKKDGSILILPDGATREDLVSTRRFHEYIRKWAPYWYRDQDVSNGSLFLVTGCDKTSDWALATFPETRGREESELRYQWRPNYQSRWVGTRNAFTNDPIFTPEEASRRGEWTRDQCIFIRSMRISLGGALWSSAVPAYYDDLLAGSHSIVLQHKAPPLYRITSMVLNRLKQGVSPVDVRSKFELCHQEMFHPNFALAQILLDKYPRASITLVDDKVWIDLAKHGNGTLDDIKALTEEVFKNNSIINDDGVVYFSNRATDTLQVNDKIHNKKASHTIPFPRTMTVLEFCKTVTWA